MELLVDPTRVIRIRVAQVDVPIHPEAIEHVVVRPEHRVQGGHEASHIAAVNPAVDIVMRVSFQHPGIGGEVQLAANRWPTGKELKVGLAEDVLDHRCSDPGWICLRRLRHPTIGIVERTRRVPEDIRNRGVRSPVPVGQRKFAVPGQLSADPLKVQQVAAVPRQEEPIAVGAIVEMDIRLVVPVARIVRTQPFHCRYCCLVGLNNGI